MKHTYTTLIALLIFAAVSAQEQTVWPRHSIGAGPIAGYNLDSKSIAYGAGLLYEFRPFKKFGFISAFTYERTQTDVSDFNFAGPGVDPVFADQLLDDIYSLSIGARYYLQKFYIGATGGIGYNRVKTTLVDGRESGTGEAYEFYKNVGLGYQLALRNQDLIEVEAATFGTKRMKIGGTVRYKFGNWV